MGIISAMTDPKLPSTDEVQALGSVLGMHLSKDDASSFREMMRSCFYSCSQLETLQEPKPAVKYPLEEGYRPEPEDNPYFAWQRKTWIRGAEAGPLLDMRVGVKDTICVAGVPMSAGSQIVNGFVPDIDATIVTRLLDAGAVIAGKTTSAGGVGSTTGKFATARNPRKPTHAPGGSSTGSAAALAAGDVELALGGDQGGTIRIPASWSGVCGLKPTYGLVPYTGVISNEITMTHPGPMATNVRDVARMLAVIAGPDPLDSRTHGVKPTTTDYTASLRKDIRGLRVGILQEGFNQAPWTELGLVGSEPVVDQKVFAAVDRLRDAGAITTNVSVPMHIDGVHIFYAMYNEGNAHMYRHANVGTNVLGFYNTKLLERAGWRDDPDALSAAAKSMLLTAEYLERRYRGRYYARAQNIRRLLVAAYDEALAAHDVLVMPTVPCRATQIPTGPITPQESVAFAMQMINNTCQFGVTGHPAISVPCGVDDDLPVGIMIVGKHLDELTVLQVADAVERSGSWQEL